MNITEASKYVGRSTKTLQRWERDGILIPESRTLTNRRVYSKSQLDLFLGRKLNEDRKIIAYSRVSSQSQKNDLLSQRKLLETFCCSKGYTSVDYIDEIGGGMNFKRTKLKNIFSDVQKGLVKTIVISHKDRLCRFGFDFLEFVCQENGCSIEVINAETTSPEKEMVEDLLSIIHCFSCRLYGLRKNSKKIKELLK